MWIKRICLPAPLPVVLYEDEFGGAQSFYCDRLGFRCWSGSRCAAASAGDAQLLLRRHPAGCTLGPSMIGLEASSVNKLYDRFSQSPDYKEAGVLRDTDFDARRLFQMYDPAAMWWRSTPICAMCERKF